jgi:hypothetical protein
VEKLLTRFLQARAWGGGGRGGASGGGGGEKAAPKGGLLGAGEGREGGAQGSPKTGGTAGRRGVARVGGPRARTGQVGVPALSTGLPRADRRTTRQPRHPPATPQCGVNPSQLGVITPYEGQRAHVTATLVRQGPLRQELYRAVEVSSVDAFQVGRGHSSAKLFWCLEQGWGWGWGCQAWTRSRLGGVTLPAKLFWCLERGWGWGWGCQAWTRSSGAVWGVVWEGWERVCGLARVVFCEVVLVFLRRPRCASCVLPPPKRVAAPQTHPPAVRAHPPAHPPPK